MSLCIQKATSGFEFTPPVIPLGLGKSLFRRLRGVGFEAVGCFIGARIEIFTWDYPSTTRRVREW
jgi:hypothetical protein